MRHVSRTHRVAVDWLFDRINLDSKIQIKYIDTKNQLADILTKGKMKTPAPSTNDPAQEEQLQKYQERIEKLSQQDRVSKFCTRAGFLTTVDVGQYFMTKDTDEFLQSTEPGTCRENTLPRDETSTDPKGWIRGNTKIGPVLESHNQLPTR